MSLFPNPVLRVLGAGIFLAIYLLAFVPLFLGQMEPIAFSSIVIGITGWLFFCLLRPVWGFYILLFFVTTFYVRSNFVFFSPYSNAELIPRTATLTDLMWLPVLCGFFPEILHFLRFDLRRIPLSIWITCGSFLFFFIMLPLCGIFLAEKPSTGILLTGLRGAQWASLGICFICLSKRQGSYATAKQFIRLFAFSMGIHTVYSLIQYANFVGFLPDYWLLFDRYCTWVAQQTPASANWHFVYPRMTGLDTNPNNYGCLSALSGIMTVAWALSKRRILPFSFMTLGLGAIVGLALSSSRGGLLGFIMGSSFIFLMSLLQMRDKKKMLQRILAISASPQMLGGPRGGPLGRGSP